MSCWSAIAVSTHSARSSRARTTSAWPIHIGALQFVTGGSTPCRVQPEAPAKPNLESTVRIAPFTIHVADAAIADLTRRLELARWPDDVNGGAWTSGMP